jgi:hypothetical protein
VIDSNRSKTTWKFEIKVMLKKLVIALFIPVLFNVVSANDSTAQDAQAGDVQVDSGLSQAELLELERLRANYLRKAERDADRSARLQQYRERQRVQKEAQVQQMQLMYHHNILAQQQMMMHYSQMQQVAAMQAMANRAHVNTRVVNPHLEIMQGGINQKINTSQSNLIGNFVTRRAY